MSQSLKTESTPIESPQWQAIKGAHIIRCSPFYRQPTLRGRDGAKVQLSHRVRQRHPSHQSRTQTITSSPTRKAPHVRPERRQLRAHFRQPKLKLQQPVSPLTRASSTTSRLDEEERRARNSTNHQVRATQTPAQIQGHKQPTAARLTPLRLLTHLIGPKDCTLSQPRSHHRGESSRVQKLGPERKAKRRHASRADSIHPSIQSAHHHQRPTTDPPARGNPTPPSSHIIFVDQTFAKTTSTGSQRFITHQIHSLSPPPAFSTSNTTASQNRTGSISRGSSLSNTTSQPTPERSFTTATDRRHQAANHRPTAGHQPQTQPRQQQLTNPTGFSRQAPTDKGQLTSISSQNPRQRHKTQDNITKSTVHISDERSTFQTEHRHHLRHTRSQRSQPRTQPQGNQSETQPTSRDPPRPLSFQPQQNSREFR